MEHGRHEHALILKGTGVSDRRVSARVLHDLLGVLIDGCRKALRLRLQGTSTPGGAEPRWLRPASELDVTFPRDGEALAIISAKPLIATLPTLFSQRTMFDELDPQKSPFDLFEDAIEDATGAVEDSPRYDPGLLKVVAQFEDLLGGGAIDSLSLVNGRTVLVDAAGVERATILSTRTRPPEPAYVVGLLEGITYSDSRFKVALPDGSALLGHAQAVGHQVLRTHWGQRVAIQGLLHYRPSGALAGLEARTIDIAEAADVADAFLVGDAAQVPLSETEANTLLRLVREPPAPAPALVSAWTRRG